MSRVKLLSLTFILFLLMALSWICSKPVVVIGVAVNGKASFFSLEGQLLSVVQSYVTWNNRTNLDFRYKVESFVYHDDPADAMMALKEKGAVVVVGYPLSSEALKVVDVAQKLRLPILSPLCSSPFLSRKDDWFFRVVKDSFQEGQLQRKLLLYLGAKDVAVYKTRDNNAYVGSLFDGLRLGEDGLISLAGEYYYPESLEREFCSADAALIMSDPSRAFWTLQDIHLRFPETPVLFSRWSWISNLDKYVDMPGADFYVNSPFDYSSGIDDPFVSFMTHYLSIPLSDLVLHTVVSLKLLDEVFACMPKARGEELRSILSSPRSVQFSGKTISFDRFGDADSESSFYLYSEGKFQEVPVR